MPTGAQNVAETTVEFVDDQIVLQTIGPEGLRFTPFLLTLFTFVFTCNLWGLIPGVQMPVNARIALPMFMALLVYVRLHHRRHHPSGPDQATSRTSCSSRACPRRCASCSRPSS